MAAEAPGFWVRLLDRGWRVGLRVAYASLQVWWFLRRPNLESAFVAVWRDGELLLIRNSYRDGITIPCGGVSSRETPLQAARRELEEEVGIRVAPDALEPACVVRMPFEWKQDNGHFFELHLDASTPVEVAIDRREVIWAEFRPEAHLEELPISPQVRAYLSQRRA